MTEQTSVTIEIPGQPPINTTVENLVKAGEKVSTEPGAVNIGGVSGERLRQYIERVERLTEEKSGISDDIKDIYAEAKSAGFDTKVMRQVVKLRCMDAQKRMEQEELLELYKAAIGL